MIGDAANVIGEVVVMMFVVAVLLWAAYVLIRPFTHFHYHHSSDRLWRPLN